MEKENKVLAWHFVGKDRELSYGDNRKVKTGRLYKVSDRRPLKLCRHGLHASERLIDAVKYAMGPILCRVELIGEVCKDQDKMVAYQRRVLWTKDITKEFGSSSRLFAMEVIHLWEAPDVVIKFLKTGKEEFRVAAKNASIAISKDITKSDVVRSAAASARWATKASGLFYWSSKFAGNTAVRAVGQAAAEAAMSAAGYTAAVEAEKTVYADISLGESHIIKAAAWTAARDAMKEKQNNILLGLINER